jgi:hypothetical protein
MSKPTIFISHIGEEKKIAVALKDFLDEKFLKSANIFVSSHDEGLTLGVDWFDTIKKSVKDCQLMILLCSPISINRPWINFEAGAGWIKDIPVIPLCHSGMEPGKLPVPINKFQGAMLNNVADARKLFSEIAKILSSNIPKIDEAEFLKSIGEYENEIIQSQLLKNVSFVVTIVAHSIRNVIFSILRSGHDDPDATKILQDATIGKFELICNSILIENLYHLYDSYVPHTNSQKVYNKFADEVNQLTNDVKFILSYNAITIPEEIKELLHDWLIHSLKFDGSSLNLLGKEIDMPTLTKVIKDLSKDETTLDKNEKTLKILLTNFLDRAKWICKWLDNFIAITKKLEEHPEP